MHEADPPRRLTFSKERVHLEPSPPKMSLITFENPRILEMSLKRTYRLKELGHVCRVVDGRRFVLFFVVRKEAGLEPFSFSLFLFLLRRFPTFAGFEVVVWWHWSGLEVDKSRR